MSDPARVGELLPGVLEKVVGPAGAGYDRWAKLAAQAGSCHPVHLTAQRWARGPGQSGRNPGPGQGQDANHQAGQGQKAMQAPTGWLPLLALPEVSGGRGLASQRPPRQAPHRGQDQLADAQRERRGTHGPSVPFVLAANTAAAAAT